MTRVWLTPWEWACCGDRFEVGDDVDFGVSSRDASFLADRLGAELVHTVDAVESHHEDEHPDRVRGRVIAVHEVTREVIERRFDHFVDPYARARPSGEAGRPEGLPPGARLSRQETRIEPMPGTTRSVSVQGVPFIEEHRVPSVRPDHVEESTSERRRQRVGWIVDVEELPPGSRIA